MFSLSEQRPLFFSNVSTSAAIRRHEARGEARRLAPRLYTAFVDEDPASLIRAHWSAAAAGYFPGSVIVDRTAAQFVPAPDGSVFLSAPYARIVDLPGLRLRAREGAGPLGGDQPWMGERIFMASRPRMLLDNLRRRATRAGGTPRTLSRQELEGVIERLVAAGAGAIGDVRNQARSLAAPLDAADELELLDSLIGAMQGTRNTPLQSQAARARRAGLPVDRHRLVRFEQLASQLAREPSPRVPANPDHDPSTLGFFEAYFSNFIEGTEFTLNEAARIVFDGDLPADRPRDAHDILGTYRLLADPIQQIAVPRDAGDLVDMLQAEHASMLAQRPEARPGMFKVLANRAGATRFVEPDAVLGTLAEGWRFYDSLPLGFARACFAMFLVAEVHPFTDGNGRMARVRMNAELSAAGAQRIVVRTKDRSDYLYALRGMSGNGNARSLIRVLEAFQQTSGRTNYTSRDAAELALLREDAFTEPDDRML